MKKYKITYREQGQMGWDKRKTATATAKNETEAKAMFDNWASKPSQYRRTFIKLIEVKT